MSATVDENGDVVAYMAPRGMLAALRGDRHDRAVAKAQLGWFGCLDDEAEAYWGAEEIERMRAEDEAEQAALRAAAGRNDQREG
jgi:hypothetical protein